MNLNEIASKYKIFIDTCTWMHPPATSFLKEVLPRSLETAGETVKVPAKIVEEVNRLVNSNDPDKRQKARAAVHIMQGYYDRKLARTYGSSDDPFVDQTILYVFTQFRSKYHLALITQDKSLAFDVNNLNYQQAVRGNSILVLRIDSQGQLREWVFDGPTATPNRPADTRPPVKPESVAPKRTEPAPTRQPEVPIQRFPEGKQVAANMNTPLTVSSVPGIYDTVVSKRFGRLVLQQEIGSGGEGNIFVTDNSMICKVYKKEMLTVARREKLQLMLQVPVELKGIAWPKDIVTNAQGEFVGYVMDVAYGKPLQTSVFYKPLLMKNFPNWQRRHLVRLSISILDKIEYLHQRNIIIGDINPLNILVKNEREVFLVDTDSYQIGDFPCPVGTVNYTAPEIQGKNYATFLRTMRHEQFAVATLLFMILLPGKPPYSQQGGGSPSDNIKSMDFSYPFGENTTGKVPDGPWRFIWSHLPYKLKEAFYNCFRNNVRITASEWRDLLKQYYYSINKGWLNDELFPEGHKIPEGKQAKMVCSKCQQEVIVHIDQKTSWEKRRKPFVCVKCFEDEKYNSLFEQINQNTGQSTAAKQAAPTAQSTYRPAQPQPTPPWATATPPRQTTASTTTGRSANTGTQSQSTRSNYQPPQRPPLQKQSEPTFLEKMIGFLRKL